MSPYADTRRARRLRQGSTDAERILWALLRRDALGVHFRRQHPIPPSYADFACPAARLVIELDGGQHGPERDAARDATMRAAGWRVLRFWNHDVMGNRDGVVARILEALTAATSGHAGPLPSPPPLRGRGGRVRLRGGAR